MGLLQRMADTGFVQPKKDSPEPETPVQKKSNSVGLLKKSMIVSNDDKLDFFEFINKYKIPHIELLSLNNNSYIALYSAGFDGQSICLSYSTVDFWNGLIPEEQKLYSFTEADKSILPLYQFFSQDIKSEISNIHLYKSNQSTIILFCIKDNKITNLNLAADLQKIDTDKIDLNMPQTSNNDSKLTMYDYTLDFSEAIQSFILTEHKNILDERISTALSNAIYYKLQQNFPSPNLIQMHSAGNFELSYYSETKLPDELLFNHLRFESKYFLKDHSNLINIEYNGCTGAE